MPDVGRGDHHSLNAGEPAGGADLEESLDLLVHRPDRQHAAVLVHRTRHRELLVEGEPPERGQQGAELGNRGAVPVHLAVGLLEHEARGQRGRPLGRVAGGQQRGQDQHALRVDGAGELDLALDVHHLALAHAAVGGDPGGERERLVAGEGN